MPQKWHTVYDMFNPTFELLGHYSVGYLPSHVMHSIYSIFILFDLLFAFVRCVLRSTIIYIDCGILSLFLLYIDSLFYANLISCNVLIVKYFVLHLLHDRCYTNRLKLLSRLYYGGTADVETVCL